MGEVMHKWRILAQYPGATRAACTRCGVQRLRCLGQQDKYASGAGAEFKKLRHVPKCDQRPKSERQR